MSSKPMDIFPDLHHKMSKKIAQLTKVIYHLNTKNEDHQSELDTLTSNHQMEIQQILRDAAARISKFKEIVENKQASMNQDAKVEKLQKKHEAEKAAALQEFNNFKLKMNDRDQKIAQQFQKKYDGMRKELEEMNRKFQDKIGQFESTNKQLKQSLESAAQSGSSGMAELKKKYEQEIEDLVQTSNQKYQAMLVEQLHIQKTITADMEKQMQQLRDELTSKFKADLERELGQERARLGGDKQSAMLELRRELEAALSQQNDEFTKNMERIKAELKSKSAQCVAVQSKAEVTIADLNSKIDAMRKSMSEQLGGQEQRASSLSKELSSMREELSSALARVVQRDEELAKTHAMLNDKNAELVKLEDKLNSAQQEIEKLKVQLKQAEQSGASSADELRQKLAAAQREAESFRAEINQIASTLATVRNELKKTEKSAEAAAKESTKKIDQLNADKAKLEKQIQDLHQNANSISANASEELSTLRKSMEHREAALNREKMLALQESEKALDALRESHRKEAASLEASKTALMESYAVKESQLQQELSDSKDKYTADMERIQKDFERQTEEAAAAHAVEAESLRNSLGAMESQLQSISEQAETEKIALKGEVSKWEGKVKGLQKELDSRRKEGERGENVMTGLKNQVESLREELKASQKAFREKMDMSKGKLEAEWQARLDAQIAAGEKALSDAQSELIKQHSSELAALMEKHEAELKALKDMLQHEANSAAGELAENEKLRQQLEADLMAEKSARAAQVSELNTTHSAERQQQEEAHSAELDCLRNDYKRAAEERENLLTQSHNAEVERLNNLLEGNKLDFTQRMAHALESSKNSAEAALKKALAEQQSVLKAEESDALKAQAGQHADQMSDQKNSYEQQKDMLTQSLTDIKQQYMDANEQISSLQKTIETEREERQKREEEFVRASDQREREHESDIRNEKEASERKILEVMDRANADIKILKQEHVEVRNQYEDRISEMGKEYQALEQRWLNRESRPEDVARIEQLLREIADKDELVIRTKEEMLYFKREMLNREENYNQKFGRSPNVGVMQVLKTKDSTDTKLGPDGRARPTQMRMVNPNGGGTLGMTGLGAGGLSVGGGGGGGGGDSSGSMKSGMVGGAQDKRGSHIKLTKSAK